MTREKAQDLFLRFLNAVTGMAVSSGAMHARVADVVTDVVVFARSDFPSELKAPYEELLSLLSGPSVPEGARNHPEVRKQTPAYYLSPRKARRAADLIINIFESIVFTLNDEPPSTARLPLGAAERGVATDRAAPGR